MAQTKKKQSTTKQSASRSRATKQSTKNAHKRQTSSKKKQAATPLQLEIQNWLILFAMILITLGIYLKGSMGVLGTSISAVFVGLFGFSAYLISVFSVLIAGLNLFGKIQSKTWKKVIAGYSAFIFLSVLFHIMNAQKLTTVGEMYQRATAFTGGVVGGSIGRLLSNLLGTVGSVILVVFVLVIIGIIVTERSFVKGVKHAAGKTKEGSQKVRDYTSERAAEYTKRREERRMQALLREEEQKAWASAGEGSPRLDMEEPAYPGGDRQIVIRGLKTAAELEDEKVVAQNAVDIPLISHDSYLEKKRRFEKRMQAKRNEEDKKNSKNEIVVEEFDVETEAVLIPSEEAYEEAVLISDTDEISHEDRELLQDNIVLFSSGNMLDDSGAEDSGTTVRNIDLRNESATEQAEEQVEPKVQSDSGESKLNQAIENDVKTTLSEFEMENLAKTISTEKAFAKEEFPTGYQDQDETLRKLGNGEDRKGFQTPPKPVGPSGKYEFPSIELLKEGNGDSIGGTKEELLASAKVLEEALLSYGVEAKVMQVNRGPAVTRFELQPKQGVKVSRIVNLTDDIAMNLAAPSIRIEAPIPGKSAVGIEVPNKEISMVTLRDVIDSNTFRKATSKLTFSLGKDIDGEVRVADIAKMPHLLIAGATGSGKSVCINSLIVSLIYKADPNDVKLILIDPKVVELSVYNGIPHLLLPVVNDPKKASATLNWAVQEMTKRYKKFAEMNVRDIRGYNEAITELGEDEQKKMPQIVIVIDELADLMMVASKEVESSICRIAQMARAAGMHLVIATQRPSVDVITGLIKANIPSRLAFAVSSGVDSRTILDNVGAEKLLGKGDMLFSPIGASKPVRIQGTFVSDKEVEAVVEAVRLQSLNYDSDLMDTLQREEGGGSDGIEDEIDEYLEEAVKFVVDKQRASISMLQRAFRIGFNRAARLMDALYARGVVGPDEGSKPRKVLMTKEEWENNEFY